MKKILIGLGVVVFLIILISAYFIIDDIFQENKLAEEMNKIVSLTEKEDIDMNEINKLLERTITERKYAKLEVAAKRYLKDSLDNIVVIHDLLSNEDLINILSLENIAEDGPEFNKTRAYITQVKENIEDTKNKYYEFLTEEKALSYLDSSDLSDYYIDLYIEQVIGDVDAERNNKTVENSLNDVIQMLEIEERVINFLIENKDYWTVNEENIVFDTNELVQEYNTLVGELNYI